MSPAIESLFVALTSSIFWAIVIGFLIWLDAILYIRKQMPHTSKRKYYLAGLIATGATLISIIMHELAHAGVASLFGIGTVDLGFGPLFAYVELETSLMEIHPWQVIAITLAGPAMNLLIGAVAAIPVKLWRESIPENTIQYISYINIRLGRLNLIPFSFLDGGKALHGFFRLLINDPGIAHLLVSIAFGIYLYYWISYGRHRKKLEDKLAHL